MNKNQKPLLKQSIVALMGTIIVAICCFTPVLVILFTLIGLSVIVSYLDYILIPLLVMLLVLTVISFYKWYRIRKSC